MIYHRIMLTYVWMFGVYRALRFNYKLYNDGLMGRTIPSFRIASEMKGIKMARFQITFE